MERDGLGNSVPVEQERDVGVGGHEWQAVGNLESLLAEAALLPDAGDAQGGLADHLERQPRSGRATFLARPAAHKIPDTQPQLVWHEQPQAGHRARHLVRRAGRLASSAADAPHRRDRDAFQHRVYAAMSTLKV